MLIQKENSVKAPTGWVIFATHIDLIVTIFLALEDFLKAIQGVSKKVYSWKILAKLTSAQNWQKLSVSPISFTPSGTSSTKIISNYIVLWVGNVLLKGTFKRAWAQKWVTLTWIKIWSMLYQLSKFWKIWCTLRQTRELKKPDISSLS